MVLHRSDKHFVYWLTGLSGAGKTTIGSALYDELKKTNPSIVLLDGDKLREVFGGNIGYSREDRMACAMRYAKLCKLLSLQGITVVCCTISMFDSIRDWNRSHIPGYVEVYLKVSPDVLEKRDQKGLYTGFEKGITSQIMGLDIEIEEPKLPDILIENNGILSVSECIEIILNWRKES